MTDTEKQAYNAMKNALEYYRDKSLELKFITRADGSKYYIEELVLGPYCAKNTLEYVQGIEKGVS